MSIFPQLSRLRAKRSDTKRNRRSKKRLSMEGLEARKVFASMVMLDFDGVTESEIDALEDKMQIFNTPESGGMKGFIEGFDSLNNSTHGFMDFDGNGSLDRDDARLAIEQIVSGVRQKFAPYDVSIFTEGSTSRAIDLMESSSSSDALVIVRGFGGPGGQSPLDEGNRFDAVSKAESTVGTASWIAGISGLSDAERQQSFVVAMSNFIAHEVGHSFGLKHIDVSAHPEANDRNLMDPFLGIREMSFWDQDLQTTDGETQNQHEELLRVLGASDESWAAVLRPGELTIEGSNYNDDWEVLEGPGGTWQVNQYLEFSGSRYLATTLTVDPSGTPDIHSLNQFTEPITTIHFSGGHNNDVFRMQSTIPVDLLAYGGSGNDTIYGGAGNDTVHAGPGNDIVYSQAGNDDLYGGSGSDRLNGGSGNDYLNGGAGNDSLFGSSGVDYLNGSTGNDYLRGGSGSDRMFGSAGNDRIYGESGNDLLDGGSGDDKLYGGSGNDYLFGRDGADRLFGGDGNDLLDGGFDFMEDYLAGQAGVDTLVQHHYYRTYGIPGYFRYVAEDRLDADPSDIPSWQYEGALNV
jgi:hypothetical protein